MCQRLGVGLEKQSKTGLKDVTVPQEPQIQRPSGYVLAPKTVGGGH